MGGFSDLPGQFGGDLTCKENDMCDILPVGPGGGTSISLLYRNYPECNSDGKEEITGFEMFSHETKVCCHEGILVLK